jgi:hypothetical protein
VISASVVSNRPAIETAFYTAERVTLTGSTTPCASMLPNAPVSTL